MTTWYDESRGRWRYDFQVNGARHAKECVGEAGNPVTSKRAADACEADARRIAKIVHKLPRSADLTWAEVINALSEKWQQESGWEDRRPMVQEILQFFGSATAMRDTDGAKIDDYIAFALSRPLVVWIGGPGQKDKSDPKLWKVHPSGRTRSPARVNRYLVHVRAAFDRAYKTRDPVTRERAIEEVPEIEDLAEMKRKGRPVPDRVLNRLQEILPSHVIDGMVVTLFCGFRESEAFQLKDDGQIDWLAGGLRLYAEDVKDAEDAFLPCSDMAMGYLRALAMEADARGTLYLITWRPAKTDRASAEAKVWRPIESPKTAWGTAMDKIEKEFGRRYRWHDIRGAFITHVAMTSGPMAAQRMARHSDFKTTQRYIEVADEALRTAADRAFERPALGVVKGGKA